MYNLPRSLRDRNSTNEQQNLLLKENQLSTNDNSQTLDQNDAEQNVNDNDQEGDEFHVLFNDLALFESSSIGVYEFSREFLSIVRRHRIQPKARAILLDLLQRIIPEDNRCPKTIAEMRKLVACNQRAYSELFKGNSDICAHFSTRNVSDTIRPQSHYLLPSVAEQTSTSNNNKSFDIKRSRSSELSPRSHKDRTELSHSNGGNTAEEESLTTEIGDPSSMIYHSDQLPVNILLPHILQTIGHLSQEVTLLRESLQHSQNHFASVRRFKRRAVFSTSERAGLYIYDESDNKVLLSRLTHEEMQKTIDVSRYDENRLIYDNNDITDLVLDKIELSPYLHNPSLCGRMVADVLFSPNYLSNKHILAEGQFSSRARLELLPPEMTHLFYESLRKLGVSRIAEEDREHWLYLARDGVNQRARDLKANRKRKFYTDEHPPLFVEEQI